MMRMHTSRVGTTGMFSPVLRVKTLSFVGSGSFARDFGACFALAARSLSFTGSVLGRDRLRIVRGSTRLVEDSLQGRIELVAGVWRSDVLDAGSRAVASLSSRDTLPYVSCIIRRCHFA